MNLTVFLHSQSSTIVTQAHDYPEWHKGRLYYALWYIEIDHPELLNYLKHLRQSFSQYLFQPNARQFHITLYICGFLTKFNPSFDDDFSIHKIKQQFQDLKKSNLRAFKLKTGQINSFSSALFVDIHDEQNSLSKIRTSLAKSTQEIAPICYYPHITLGLYNDEFSSQEIVEVIRKIPQQHFEISIEQLRFGIYQAKELQGRLFDLHHYSLNSSGKYTPLELNGCCN